MSTIKIGNRDFWEEAYQICSGYIAAIEKNKVRSIIKEPTPFEELKDYQIDLSSLNSSFEKKATSDVKTSTKQFQTNAMNSPLTPTFYETPPSVLANSTKNKNVKVHEENVLGGGGNDLNLPGTSEQIKHTEELPVQNLQGIAATQGLRLEDALRLPSKLPTSRFNLFSKLSKAVRALGLSALLASSFLSGFGLSSVGLMASDIATTSLKQATMGKIVKPVVKTPLEQAVEKAHFIKNPTEFIKEIETMSQLPDVKLPADIAGKTKDQLTPAQNKLRLELQNKATFDVYASGDEAAYVNRFHNLDRIVDSEGNLNKNFILGVQQYAPTFAKKFGLDTYKETNTTGKLGSVAPELQAVFNEAISTYTGKKPFVTQGNRTAAYQHEIYKKDRFKQGRWTSTPKVATTYADGYISQSDHQNANAIDIVIPGKAQNKATGAEKVYGDFNKAMEAANKKLYGGKFELEWGGTFANGDYGHFALLPAQKAPPSVPKKPLQDAKVPSLFEALKDNLKTYEIPDNNPGMQAYQLARSAQMLTKQAFNRKIAPALGLDVSEDVITKSTPIVAEKDRLANKIQTYPIKDTGQVYHSQILNLSDPGVTFGVRNRGDYSQDILSKTGGIITTFEALAKPNEVHYKSSEFSKEVRKYKDSSGVIGIDSNGRFIAGTYGDFKDRTDVQLTGMAMNKIINFDEINGEQQFKKLKGFASSSAQTPVINYYDDAGVSKKGSLNFVVGNKDTRRYGDSDGGRIILQHPKTQDLYLVSGSFDEVKSAFNTLKGDAPYVNSWLLDNGTYVRGLSAADGKITKQMQRDYDNWNKGGGGNILYLKD